MVSLVTICCHTKLLQYYWLYPPYCILYPHGLIYNWKFVPLNSLHLFLSSLLHFSPLETTSLFFFLYLWIFFVLFVHLFCFIDSTYKWNCMLFFSLSDIFHLALPFRYIHVVANDRVSFFLWLSNIPLYLSVYTTPSFSIPLLMVIVSMSCCCK